MSEGYFWIIFFSFDCSASQNNIDYQKDIITTAYNDQRWWFSKLLNGYISVLKQGILWNKHGKQPIGKKHFKKFKWQINSLNTFQSLTFH
jgi:hypothetical protein